MWKFWYFPQECRILMSNIIYTSNNSSACLHLNWHLYLYSCIISYLCVLCVCVCICACAHTCLWHNMPMEVRGLVGRVCCFLLPCVSMMSHRDHETHWKVHLAASIPHDTQTFLMVLYLLLFHFRLFVYVILYLYTILNFKSEIEDRISNVPQYPKCVQEIRVFLFVESSEQFLLFYHIILLFYRMSVHSSKGLYELRQL